MEDNKTIQKLKKRRRGRRLKGLAHLAAFGVAGTLMVVGLYAISWIVCCGIIKLITLCFGWSFSWRIATGLWLIWCILQSIFKSNVTVNK